MLSITSPCWRIRYFPSYVKTAIPWLLAEDLLKAGWNSQAPNCSLQLNKMVSRLRKLLKGDIRYISLPKSPWVIGLKSNNKRDVSCNEVAGTVAFYRRVPV